MTASADQVVKGSLPIEPGIAGAESWRLGSAAIASPGVQLQQKTLKRDTSFTAARFLLKEANWNGSWDSSSHGLNVSLAGIHGKEKCESLGKM
jgi:hypothetical protein